MDGRDAQDKLFLKQSSRLCQIMIVVCYEGDDDDDDYHYHWKVQIARAETNNAYTFAK